MSLNIRHWLAERQIELAQMVRPGAHVAGVAFRIVQDMEVKSLTPFDISALAEVLELPLGAACLAIGPIAQLSVWLMRILSRKKPLKRNEGTWLTFQVAYLNALQGILEQESHLRRPWLNRAIDFVPPTDLTRGFAPENLEPWETNKFPAHSPFNPLFLSPELGGSQNPQSVAPTLDDQQLIALLKTLRPGRLSDSQAEQALSVVGESFLVQQMNNTAIAWLIANGAEETEAKLLTQRLVHGLPGYLLSVIAENSLPLAQLQKFVRLANSVGSQDNAGLGLDQQLAGSYENSSEFSDVNLPTEPDIASLPETQTYPLNRTRENYRAKLLQALSEPLLAEIFALKDIYVPLQGMPVAAPVKPDSTPKSATSSPVPAKPVDLMKWAIAQMKDLTSIAIIEGDSGCGKSSFCQMLAARVAQELYPRWLPILIRLRDTKLGQTLEQTLDTAFPLGRFTDRDGWLSPSLPPCLLILDGWDELPQEAYTRRDLQAFLDQLIQFQKDYVASFHGTPRHKFLLSASPSTIRHLETFEGTSLYLGPKIEASSSPLHSYSLARIVIQPMEQNEFRQWFQNWSKLQSKSIAQGYFSFLKTAGVFRTTTPLSEMAILIRQPLMLYLLGLLHRDGLLDDRIFHMDHPQLKFEIYDLVCQWLLAYPDSDRAELPHLVKEGLAHARRSPEAIANLLLEATPQTLRRQMQVAALKILQSGQYQVPQAVVQSIAGETSLASGSRGGDSLKASSSEMALSASLASPTPDWETLPAFFFHYFDRRIEFSHPNLGEYLCAEEMAVQLKTLAWQANHAYGEAPFALDAPAQVARHLYAVLGYGVLSQQLEDYLVERLRRDAARSRVGGFSLSILFERLYWFYRAYCQGRWLDEGIAHACKQAFAAHDNPLNVLQVDAAVGLNVFSLLCAIARVAQIPFWPCGDPKVALEFDPDQLLSLIGRTAVLSPTAFWQRMCHTQSPGKVAGLSQLQLSGVCLNHAMLSHANLWQANLSFASLIGTNLSKTNLQMANLSWANLAGADLFGTNLWGASLEGANLSGANLLGTNLTTANLTNACLYEARLDEETKNIASSNGAIFSLDKFQSYIKSVRSHQEPSNILGEGFSLTNPTISLIESAEGEAILLNSLPVQAVSQPTSKLEAPTLPRFISTDEADSDDDTETTLIGDLPSRDI